MTAHALGQLALVMVPVLALAWPLGAYIARVFTGRVPFLENVLGPLERLIYRTAGVHPAAEMGWKRYAGALLAFSACGVVVLYALQRFQDWLPLNPKALGPVPVDTALNTAVSFATNTNWQSYSGELTMSHFTSMAGLTVQNFVSAATGLAVLLVLARGFSRRSANGVGNFWSDLVRATLYVLLPLSFMTAIALVSQGVVQTLSSAAEVRPLEEAGTAPETGPMTQRIALGPVASQVAIKHLGVNGGGFFNANSAHPFENPTPLSSYIETVTILLLPAALCVTFGMLVGDRRQGWALLTAMVLLFVPLALAAATAEVAGDPQLRALGADVDPNPWQAGGNMEGKEVRFGPVASGLFAAVTTAASCGAVIAAHDSLTPVGGGVALFLMQLGEVVFGGVGVGLVGMVVQALLAVFAAGLMVGRTPEYLGKRIEPFEMKMTALAIVAMPVVVLLGTALAVSLPVAASSVSNPGPHGFSQVLYAFLSGANNNGSAFGGLASATPFYNLSLSFVMLIGRFWIIIPVLALAGSLAAKGVVPPGPGTLPTHTPTFIVWLVSVVLIVGGLTFFPALALGPIAEQLMLR